MCHKESLSSVRLQCMPFVAWLETGAEARVTGHATHWDSKVGSQHLGACVFCCRILYSGAFHCCRGTRRAYRYSSGTFLVATLSCRSHSVDADLLFPP